MCSQSADKLSSVALVCFFFIGNFSVKCLKSTASLCDCAFTVCIYTVISATRHRAMAWCSGSAFHLTNKVTVCQAGLVLWWVSACGQINHLGRYVTFGCLRWALDVSALCCFSAVSISIICSHCSPYELMYAYCFTRWIQVHFLRPILLECLLM